MNDDDNPMSSVNRAKFGGGKWTDMKRLTLASKAVTLLFLLGSPLDAATYSYICTVETFHGPKDDVGRVDFLGKLAMKTTVAIDRRTGAIIHPIMGNTAYRTTTVLDYGNESWAFRVLSESGTSPDDPSGGNIIYVEVAEYAEGYRKPFLAIESGIAYLGYCE